MLEIEDRWRRNWTFRQHIIISQFMSDDLTAFLAQVGTDALVSPEYLLEQYTRPNIPTCWKVSIFVSHSTVAGTESRREWKEGTGNLT